MLLSKNGLTSILLHCSLRSGNFLWLFCFLESQPEQVYFLTALTEMETVG
jgi:hypothetical protein